MSSRRPATKAKEAAADAVELVKPAAHGYEFGGPIGAALISFGLPFVCYAFAFLCNDVTGCPAPSLLSPSKLFTAPTLSTQSNWQHARDVLAREVGWPGWTGLLTVEGALGSLAWYGWSFMLYAMLPAEEAEGTELRDGGRLKYRFNGLISGLLTVFILAAGSFVLGPQFQVWTFINEQYISILTSNIIISYALATLVYIRSFGVKPGDKKHRLLAAGGHSGNIIYDWFIGRELNPRVEIPFIGEVDIKAFMETRPGLLGWFVLDLAFMAKQYGTYGYITDAMLIVVIAQGIYVFDCARNESSILTQIDLTTDGFGFMLSFGDLVWVPFIYSLQTRYLAIHPVILGPWYTLAILGIAGFGYYIFRASNTQKNTLRTNPSHPSVAGHKYINTSTGSKLLYTGWWGRARHINYLGDWTMSWAYCLPTLLSGYRITDSILTPGSRLVTRDGMEGAAIPVTYFFMLYFAILLIHRERRDEQKCRRKYGKDWDEYCRRVPWRIVPYVY